MGTRECEVCGREAYSLFKRDIEGVIMHVCSDCSNLGKEPPIERKQRIQQVRHTNNTQKFQNMYQPNLQPRIPTSPYKKKNLPYSGKERISNLKLIDNAIQLLIKTRKQHNLTTQQFALALLIKENYLKRIEKGTTSLPINLAQRIEKKYKITLCEREDSTEGDDYSQFLKGNRTQGESMVYFKNTGTQKEARKEKEN